jgi:sugar phosphate isomerase/epimerase
MVEGHANRIAMTKLLGFEAVDVGLFVEERTQVATIADALVDEVRAALELHELRCTDLFFIAGGSFQEASPNKPTSSEREFARRQFEGAAAIAFGVGAPGITILPGVVWSPDSELGWEVCIEELAWRVARASEFGIEVGVEPHIGSVVPTPELVRALVAAVPGLRVTLDISHFDVQDISPDRGLTLVPHTRHVHVRAAMPGAIQVRWDQNQSDVRGVVDALTASGYEAAYCVEYVPMPKWRCDEVDVVSETIRTRAALVEMGIA